VSTVLLTLPGVNESRPLRVTVTESPDGPVSGRRPERRERITLAIHSRRHRVAVDEHVRVRLPGPHHYDRLADVLVLPGTSTTPHDMAMHCPGALVIAAHQGLECRLRLGVGSAVTQTLGAQHASGLSWEMWASLARAMVVFGLPVAKLESASGLRAHGQHSALSSASSLSGSVCPPRRSSCARTSSAWPVSFTSE
jgi:hypothetical protein